MKNNTRIDLRVVRTCDECDTNVVRLAHVASALEGLKAQLDGLFKLHQDSHAYCAGLREASEAIDGWFPLFKETQEDEEEE